MLYNTIAKHTLLMNRWLSLFKKQYYAIDGFMFIHTDKLLLNFPFVSFENN